MSALATASPVSSETSFEFVPSSLPIYDSRNWVPPPVTGSQSATPLWVPPTTRPRLTFRIQNDSTEAHQAALASAPPSADGHLVATRELLFRTRDPVPRLRQRTIGHPHPRTSEAPVTQIEGTDLFSLNINRGYLTLPYLEALLQVVEALLEAGTIVFLQEFPLDTVAVAETQRDVDYLRALEIFRRLGALSCAEANAVTTSCTGLALTGLVTLLPEGATFSPLRCPPRLLQMARGEAIRYSNPLLVTWRERDLVLINVHLSIRSAGQVGHPELRRLAVEIITCLHARPHIWGIPAGARILAVGDFNRHAPELMGDLSSYPAPRHATFRAAMSCTTETTISTGAVDNCVTLGPGPLACEVWSGLSGDGGTDHRALQVRITASPTC